MQPNTKSNDRESLGMKPSSNATAPRAIDASPLPSLRFVSWFAGPFAIVIGCLTLVGWKFNLTVFTSIHPAWTSMAPNTAVCLICCGIAFILVQLTTPAKLKTVCTICFASFSILLGLMTLVEYVFDLNLLIDRLLLTDSIKSNEATPLGRMGPNTALGLTLIGAAIVLITFNRKRFELMAQAAAATTAIISILALLGYLCSIESFKSILRTHHMALHTSLALGALSAGVLAIRAHRGFMADFFSQFSGGVWARRMMPIVLVVPPILAALRFRGERLGYYDTDFGTGILVVAIMIIMSLVTWRNARSLNRADAERTRMADELDVRMHELSKSREELRARSTALLNIMSDLDAERGRLRQEVAERTAAEDKLRRSEERHRSLVASMTSIVWTADGDCQIVSPQPAWGAYTGQTFEQYKNSGWADAVHPDDRQRIIAEWAQARKELKPLHVEGRLWHAASQSYRFYVATGIAMTNADGTIQEWIGTVTDVNDERRAKEVLQKANEELSKKNEEMEQFTYTVSHDLKSPLVSLQGFSGYIVRDLTAGRTDRLVQFANYITEGVKRMQRTINDLLEISRVGRTTRPHEPVDVTEMVREWIIAHAQQVETIGVLVNVQDDMPVLLTDKTGLIQVFDNLITNAMKYGCTDSNARISVGAKIKGDEIHYFVRDNGPGIPKEYHERIFGLFERLRGDGDGTGVGLAIVKRIVEVQGGKTWVESEPGQGAIFWVAFPQSMVVPQSQRQASVL